LKKKIIVTADEINAVRTMKCFRIRSTFQLMNGDYVKEFVNGTAIAECFNSFIRHADIVKMANFTMLTSLLGNDREGYIQDAIVLYF